MFSKKYLLIILLLTFEKSTTHAQHPDNRDPLGGMSQEYIKIKEIEAEEDRKSRRAY